MSEDKTETTENKPSSKIKELVQTAATTISTMDKGMTILHLEISDMIGVKYRLNGRTNPNYYTYADMLKNTLMRDHGIFLASVKGLGYQICELGDEYLVCKNGVLRGTKIVVKHAKQVNFISIDKITDEKKRTQTLEFSNNIGNIYGILRNSILTPALTA